MKKIILALFMLAIGSIQAFSQESKNKRDHRKSPEERAEFRTKKLTNELSLTSEQQVKVKALILKREQEKESFVKARREEHAKTKEELKQILSPEQFQKLEKREAQKKMKRQERRKIKSETSTRTPSHNASKIK